MAMVGASNGEQYYAKGGLFWNLQTPVSDWTGLDWTGVPYSTISIIYERKTLPNFYFYLFLI